MRNQSLWVLGGVNEIHSLEFWKAQEEKTHIPFQLTSSEQFGSNVELVVYDGNTSKLRETPKASITAAGSDVSAAAGVTACGW